MRFIINALVFFITSFSSSSLLLAEADFDLNYLSDKCFPLGKSANSSKLNRIFKKKYNVKSINERSLGNSTSLPSYYSLRDKGLCGKIDDQKNLNSCTANAIAKAMEIDVLKTMKRRLDLSRLFIYYNTMRYERTHHKDAGVRSLRKAFIAIKRYGAPVEKYWPYRNLKWRFKKKPYRRCYRLARRYRNLDNKIRELQQSETVLKSLISQNIPIVYGMLIFDSFLSGYTANTGIVKMPQASEGIVGGHAPILVGYDDAKQMFLGMNSWGRRWGDQGYFYIPYEYILNSNLCWDFFAVKAVGSIDKRKKRRKKRISRNRSVQNSIFSILFQKKSLSNINKSSNYRNNLFVGASSQSIENAKKYFNSID